MNRFGHQAPPFDLFAGMDPWGKGVALPLLGNLGGLRNDQSGTGSLRVIEGIESPGDISGLLAS